MSLEGEILERLRLLEQRVAALEAPAPTMATETTYVSDVRQYLDVRRALVNMHTKDGTFKRGDWLPPRTG